MEANTVVNTDVNNLDAEWFRCFGVPDPESASAGWKSWLCKQRDEDAILAELLRRVVGVTDGAARSYVKGRTQMLRDTTLAGMDGIFDALGRKKPERVEGKSGRRWPRYGVVLFTNLEGVPSPRFHLEAANCLVRAGSLRGHPVSLHVPGDEELCSARQIARVLRILNPRAVVWLRRTPRPAELTSLARVQNLPVVMLHANPSPYAPPVIGNVIPDHQKVAEMVTKWARRLTKDLGGLVPIVAMRPETEGPTLRGERIAAIRSGLLDTGFTGEFVEVPDYAGANAAQVLKQWPAAPGYACLSDAIAVSVAQLLLAHGQEATGRVLGFDDSSLSLRHGITSINQHLPNAAERVFDLLYDFFENGWRKFQIIRTPLTISLRPD